jgi:hypothetical protein
MNFNLNFMGQTCRPCSVKLLAIDLDTDILGPSLRKI